MTVFFNLRKFHNYVKNIYIKKYTSKKDSYLLDLASGKGGDLLKWKNNKNIKKVNGYDINETSIKEAKRRRNLLKINKKISLKVLDLSKNVLHCSEKYQVITCMFAFHYFFSSKETLDTILQSISNCSKKETIFILTLFDGSKIKNDIIYEDFYIKKLDDNIKKYDNKIDVFLKDSVLDKPEIEYLVQPDFLIKKMKNIDFDLIEMKSFKDIYTEDYKLSEQEKILSFLNNVYIFKRS